MSAEQNYKAEIDRLRLLLQKATGARKALMVEIEPAPDGFRIVVTGITEAHEMEMANLVASHIAVLLRGSYRWPVKAIHVFSAATDEERQHAEAVTQSMTENKDCDSLPPEPGAISMSDPNHDGPFECCGQKMEAVYFPSLGDALIAAYLCDHCGVWRHAQPREETQLRALAERMMATRLQERAG